MLFQRLNLFRGGRKATWLRRSIIAVGIICVISPLVRFLLEENEPLSEYVEHWEGQVVEEPGIHGDWLAIRTPHGPMPVGNDYPLGSSVVMEARQGLWTKRYHILTLQSSAEYNYQSAVEKFRKATKEAQEFVERSKRERPPAPAPSAGRWQ